MKIIESKKTDSAYIKDKSICPECDEMMYNRGDSWVCFKCLLEVEK